VEAWNGHKKTENGKKREGKRKQTEDPKKKKGHFNLFYTMLVASI